MKLLSNIFSSKIQGIHKAMNLNPITLRFRDKLEKDFKKYYFEYSLDFIRISLLFSIVFYLFFFLLDIYVFPNHKLEFLVIRVAISFPVAFSALLFSYNRFFQKYWQGVMAALVIFAGIGIIVMMMHGSHHYQYNYYVGLLLVLMYNYMFSKLKFIYSVLAGWSLFLIYEAYLFLWLDLNPIISYMNTFFFASANVFGMVASYFVEYYTRREFFTIHLLNSEKHKVEKLNESLEEKVNERTDELSEANKELLSKNQLLNKSQKELQHHKDELEEKVRLRTVELEEKIKEVEDSNTELQRFNDLFVGREFRIKELKDQVKELKEALEKINKSN